MVNRGMHGFAPTAAFELKNAECQRCCCMPPNGFTALSRFTSQAAWVAHCSANPGAASPPGAAGYCCLVPRRLAKRVRRRRLERAERCWLSTNPPPLAQPCGAAAAAAVGGGEVGREAGAGAARGSGMASTRGLRLATELAGGCGVSSRTRRVYGMY